MHGHINVKPWRIFHMFNNDAKEYYNYWILLHFYLFADMLYVTVRDSKHLWAIMVHDNNIFNSFKIK